MLGESLRLVAAKDLLGFIGAEVIVFEAANVLSEGVDRHSIRQLTGTDSAESDEVRTLFHEVLRELGIETPSPHEAAILVATEVASRIVGGATSPYDGAKAIWNIVGRLPLEDLSELDTFVYAAGEWEERPKAQ